MNDFRVVAAVFAGLVLAGATGCGSGGTASTGGGGGGSTPYATATLSAATLSFNGVALNTTSSPQSTTLSNTGTAALNISSIALSGADAAQFTLSTTCGTTLAAGSSCLISGTYKPVSGNVANAVITLTVSNATPATQTIALSGSTGFVTKCTTQTPRKAQPTGSANAPGVAFTGKVMAGSTALIGASVQLYAAGNAGNGSAATALLPTPVVSDNNGAFSIATAYTCPNSLSLLYVVARGGKAGASGTANAATVLMAPVGICNAVASGTSVVVNELSTVASAYSLAAFASAGGNFGASATNFQGLALAESGEASLVSRSAGTVPGTSFPATGVAPTALLNSLANALHGCVVSALTCSSLYSASTVGTSVPANTLDAAVNIARNPGKNVAAVYAATQGTTAFSPALSKQPTDWVLFETLGGGGMNAPSGLGVDSNGNVWVSSYFSAGSTDRNVGSATEFTNVGTPVFPNGITGNGLREIYGLAIDHNDNIWIPDEESQYAANAGIGAVTELNPAGQPLSGGSGYVAGGLNFPVAIAVDASNVSWVVDYGNSHVTLLNNNGVPLSGASGYTSDLIAFPVAVAVDSKCYGYIANQSGNSIVKMAPDGSSFTSYQTGPGASGLAVDANDNVWVANYFGDSIGELSASGAVVTGGYKGGNLNHPQSVAIDGAGNVWVANFRDPALTELAGSASSTPGALLSPAAGLGGDAQLLEAFTVAVDGAGNVWVTNFGNNTITKFVGIGVPVRTPMLGPPVLP